MVSAGHPCVPAFGMDSYTYLSMHVEEVKDRGLVLAVTVKI